MKNRVKKHAIIFFLLLFLVAWVWLVESVGADTIVGFLGVRNSYLVAFALAVLGGVSTLTAGPFYAAIITFSTGGANSLVLGLTAGLGLVISDSVFFYLGYEGRQAISQRTQAKIDKLSGWITKWPRWLLPVIIYVYISFVPLPNDILMAALAFMKHSYKQLFVPLLLGDITFVITLSYLAKKGVEIFL